MAYPQPPWNTFHFNRTAELAATIAIASVLAVMVATSLYLWLRQRTPVYVLCLGAGLLAALNEPVADVLGHCFFPPGNWTAFTSLGRPIPLWVFLCYSLYFGGVSAFIVWWAKRNLAKQTLTRKNLWLGAAVIFLVNLSFEIPILAVNVYVYYSNIPGLKVVVPSTAADAKGLMATAIRDDNPVVFLHHYLLTLEPGEVPDGEHLVPFGKAEIRRPGGDVTIVATGWMVSRSIAAAETLAKEGIQAEVIDPRTVAPLDLETILKSVAKTGRLVLVDQAPRHATVTGIIAGDVAEHGFSSLKAPIVQVTARDAPVPYSEPLETYVIPNEEGIVAAVRKVMQDRR